MKKYSAQKKLVAARKALSEIALATQAAAFNSWRVTVLLAREHERAMKVLLSRILCMKEALALKK